MKHTIRFIIVLFSLVVAGTTSVWGITENDIVINVLPNNSAGTVTVTNISGMTVTISATPATDYFIDRSHIIAEKMVDPLATHHAPGVSSSLPISGNNPFTFTIPDGYSGAYVTVNFYKKTEGFTQITSLSEITAMDGKYQLTADVSGISSSLGEFKGTLDGGLHKIIGSSAPLFASTDGAIIRNIIFEDVNISSGDGDGDAGAVTSKAKGATRIYNCGILPTSVERDNKGNITGFYGSSVGATRNVGGLVGLLDGTSRVINCYSYANITGGNVVGGIVGNNNQTSSQTALNTIVVNCMFYGNITGGTSVYPVYGGKSINNDSDTGINPYCYFRKNATLTPTAYNRSWPAEEKNLTRFEYYRSVLNSNRKLCTWWVSGTSGTAPTDEDVANVGIAKWVLDPSIAPYPILKKWGKYPSVINLDPDKVWDPRIEIKEGDAVTSVTPHWVQRSDAKEWEGKSYGTLAVTIKAGAHGSGSTSRNIPITDMDTLNCDYSYYKIQLPYYNEVFGNPNGATHAEKYGGNYTEYVVTGWEIEAAGSTTATDYNFADRNSINGRVFAQGGYYYVPKDVTSITITARWGKAIYLSNRGRSIDRVNVTKADYKSDSPFTPAGTIPATFQNQPVYDDLQNAIKALGTNTDSPTVYDQAIVLIGNHQVKNGNNGVGYSLDSKWHPFTIMSADFDFDNEPDYCLQFQFRDGTPRPGIQPVRFDFLPVVELGLALRHDNKAYAIGIFVPQGHFEVTETAFMRTTQFEYDGFQSYTDKRIEDKSPVIINGGEYEMFVVRYHDSNRTSYFLLGGNAWIHRFAPGAHPSNASPKIYLCPINVIGGQVKELYLTGLYRPELPAPTNQGAPRCYTDGGKFDIMAGAGYEKVEAGSNVTFKINHSKITEFYGGGINATNPISGNINVTIDNSYVDKYCGGPKVGDMTGKTVTTNATGTIFGVFFGGGNGGNSYYRDLQKDGDMASSHIGTWTDNNYNWNGFKPLEVKDDDTDNKGYHAEYEFEVFNHSNGVTDQITQRGFIRWIQFGITKTGNVSSTLSDCKILGNFYGGGNLATVDGNVTSTLTNTQVAGSVFGAGYSAAIPTFQVHDKSTVSFPSITAGVITDGYIGYDSKVYEWTNEKLEGKDEAYMKAHPTYEKDGKWYCYTWNSLDDLGAVTGTATLTIDGTTTVAHSVYGGGEESAVNGNTSVTVTGGTIGTTIGTTVLGGAEYGNVFGGGKGKEKNVTAGLVKGNTTVSISGSPTILHNVYGGGAYGSVGNFNYDASGMPTACAENTGNTQVTITGGTFGTDGHENGMVFGSSRGDVATPEGEPAVDPNDRMAWVYSTHVTIGDAGAATSPTIKGSVYGSGENGHTFQNTIVDINKGIIGITDTGIDGGAAYAYRGNVYGGGCGTDMYDSDGDKTQDAYNPLAGIVQGTTTINITGGQVVHNVYGAGAMGSVGGGADATSGKTTINISGGRIGYDGVDNGHVFGAARGEYGVSTAASGLANVRETAVNINYTTTPTADNEGKTTQLIAGSVFGGGEAGTVKESVAVNMTGGLILKDLYGGGALADTQTSNWDATANSGAGDWASGKTSASATTTVRLTGGRVGEEVFGGGLGEAGKPAYVWGDVLIDLNGTTTSGATGSPIDADAKGCVVGQIFGCNNINGTPKGDVMVHVYATQNADKENISTKPDKNTDTYDVTAVYGGGNQAAYNPVTPYDGTSGSKTKVIIEGCALTSINTVYGGGNAAAVPETDVVIKSAYEIGYLFGGGNGKDNIAPGVTNPGADVGTLDHGSTIYGTGNANTLMEGGLIHEAYGGSNTKGIIKGSINQITDPKDPAVDPGCCELVVEKIVGAGKYADIDGDVNMTLSCQPNKKVNLLFAGADEANVNGNITLNITNGHFGKVFGGNNLGGAIKGKITVNVEETGCQPIKIDDLYLGSNEAAYSVFGYYESDETHPITGKKILKPRTSATDPNLPVKLDGTSYTSIDQFTNYAQPELNIISCTYIGNVFGGGFGEGAIMYANPTVNVNIVPGDHAATAVPAMMTELGLDVTKTAPNPDNLGIIRNVFGGGDAATIAGDTHVNIATEANKSAYIIGSVFGGGNAADVLGNTNVTMSDGYVFNGIFGGGYAGSVGTFTRSTAATDVNIFEHTAHDGCIGKPVSCAENTGKCTVVVNGGQIGPISVATEGMNRSKADGGPVPEGWVWGAGQGLVEDPADHPDTHFTSYVGSTDVTIGGTALIMESIIGGGEFGRVLGDTKVTIQDHCQIGVGEGKVDANNKPIRYTDGYDYGAGATTNQFVNPLTTTITNSNALTECSHYPYGKNIGTTENPNWVYLPYDPYCEKYPEYVAAHPELGPASTSNPSDGKTWIGCVFAGGSGYMPYLKKDENDNPIGYDWCPSAGLVEGNSEVRISGGHILTNVYGGNEITDVKGKSIVKMTGGTIGVPRTLEQIVEHPLTCYLFGAGKGDERSRFYNYTNTGSVEVEISGGIIYGSVFGGSEDGHVTGDIKMDIKPGAIIGTWGTSYVDGNVFGGGRGFSGNTLTAGNVGGNVTMNISGGNILGSVYGGGRLASVGTYLVETTDANYGKQKPDVGDDKHGHITINISGGTIGNDKEYIYNPTAEQKAAIPNTTFDYQNHLQYAKGGNVFTAGMGRLYALDGKTVLSSWQKLGQCKQTELNMTGGTVKSSVYGGGEIGIVAQNATLNIKGGTVGTKVADTGDATKYYYFGSVFGGGKGSTANVEGISEAGTTGGNVAVNLNEGVAENKKGAIVSQVFGCNDMNGSPKGTVTVHVYSTQTAENADIATKPEKGTDTYDVMAVYGGGNLAAYEPTDLSTGKAKVIIDGCGKTSIRQVYGGGNAASTPATDVEINGTYEIMELFGGGNGADKLPSGADNPGANVGYKDYHLVENDPTYATKEARTEGAAFAPYRYGTGEATVNIKGGTIHRVFGGSNTKGNVRKTALTMLEELQNNGEPVCRFQVDEAYGGGKSAPMDAEAKLHMACIPGLQEAYGGAEAADIHDNVTLTITNGTFNRVFGGNNISGTISGKITVNVEETGCRPVVIGELYGGGNLAAYSIYGYNDDGTPKESGENPFDDPEVNVRSFTSIGAVYGGGYGTGAKMIASPTVNINESLGTPDTYPTTGDYDENGFKGKTITLDAGKETEHTVTLPAHTKGKMGAIGDVFGGGNAAEVKGNTTVNIGTLSENTFVSVDDDPATTETDESKKPVLGADIRGNVYGGGNNAEVTGNTNVVIGKKNEN